MLCFPVLKSSMNTDKPINLYTNGMLGYVVFSLMFVVSYGQIAKGIQCLFIMEENYASFICSFTFTCLIFYAKRTTPHYEKVLIDYGL